ncbi:chromosome segregation protein [Flavobacteriales bacterium 34_180_T64]|nr:chromosome segregation protein [Flavobacteriales bacterium 34_180_T64]
MSEKDNLQNADGNEKLNTLELQEEIVDKPTTENETNDASKEIADDVKPEIKKEDTEASTEPEFIEKKADSHVEAIEESNAEDAEDESNSQRHTLEEKDYHAMSMDELVVEFDKLIKYQKVQTIKSPVEEIKTEFNSKFNELLEQKKEEFVHDGGNEIDFYFTTPLKKDFNFLYKDYKNSLRSYYKNLESDLKSNLEIRLRIIEDIKGLINVEENINTTYKHFKELQEEWRNAGAIPRDKYNNAWNTYHHHVEIFYDFLHLNRDLRDMDFKHNLDKKLKIIERAEELAKDNNTNRTFRELQVLHKMWKEDLGPVAKEHREDIWERFSNATKTIHDKRQAYYADLDKAYENNLVRKEEIIDEISKIAEDQENSHQSWQKKIKAIEALRTDFFNAGKVSIKVNEATWSKFKMVVRVFNKKKNAFYKGLKKDQYDNLQKKLDLIKIADDNKDSSDFETVTPLMKKIQNDWKKIGHVPRKDSDKIWRKFKSACNHYFDKLHSEKNAANKEQIEAFDKKVVFLDTLKTIELTGKPKSDIETIKAKINDWKTIGHVPHNKRYIEGKFNKALDGLFNKLEMDKAEVEMIKFENKLENLSQPNDRRLLDNEHNFIRKKIDELKGEINQLENNLQFFKNASEDNPFVKDVLNNIGKHKDNLTIWVEKLKKVKGMY